MNLVSKISIFSAFLFVITCSHTQKIGGVIQKEDFFIELDTLGEIDFSDREKFHRSLKIIKRELLLARKSEKILPETWDKIGRVLEIYKGIIQKSSQNQILVPFKTAITLTLDSFCLDPNRPQPDFKEVFQWVQGEPFIPYYEKILIYYQIKGENDKNLIQELIWNLANKTYYEDYPDKLKNVLKEIDPNAFLKLPSRTKSELIREGISRIGEISGTDFSGTTQIIEGKYYNFREFKSALENLRSSYELSEKQFYSQVPEIQIFTTTSSEGYSHQVITFYNPSDETQLLDLNRYYLKSSREDVQRIALTASFENVDDFKKELEQFFKTILVQFSQIYPRLTYEEQALIRQYPYESLKVFWYKERAEWAEHFLFKDKGSEGGEGDAFRHFVWAGFLAEDFGQDLAIQFLKAHEQSIPKSNPDRKMDEHNNKEGMDAALQLKKNNNFSAQNLYREALSAIKNNKLIVLQPIGTIPDDPSYY